MASKKKKLKNNFKDDSISHLKKKIHPNHSALFFSIYKICTDPLQLKAFALPNCRGEDDVLQLAHFLVHICDLYIIYN